MAHLAKTNAADTETPHKTPRASASVATIVGARLELRFLLQALCLGNQTFSGHVNP
jgi:hypothetical protein